MRRTPRRTARVRMAAAAALALLAATTAGCFTTTADFRVDAEKFIVENAELRDTLFPDSDAAISTATCSEPPNRDEGTTFPCTALDSTGGTWEFDIVITGSTGYEVNVARRPVDN